MVSPYNSPYSWDLACFKPEGVCLVPSSDGTVAIAGGSGAPGGSSGDVVQSPPEPCDTQVWFWILAGVLGAVALGEKKKRR